MLESRLDEIVDLVEDAIARFGEDDVELDRWARYEIRYNLENEFLPNVSSEEAAKLNELLNDIRDTTENDDSLLWTLLGLLSPNVIKLAIRPIFGDNNG